MTITSSFICFTNILFFYGCMPLLINRLTQSLLFFLLFSDNVCVVPFTLVGFSGKSKLPQPTLSLIPQSFPWRLPIPRRDAFFLRLGPYSDVSRTSRKQGSEPAAATRGKAGLLRTPSSCTMYTSHDSTRVYWTTDSASTRVLRYASSLHLATGGTTSLTRSIASPKVGMSVS